MFTLMPKSNVFFDMFEKSAQNALDGAKVLDDLFNNFTDVSNAVRQIKNIEHAGDEITHRIYELLDKTFVTPFDREDIQEITSCLDDVIDHIDVVANRLMIYKIKSMTEPAKALSKVILKGAGILVEVMPSLRNMKQSEKILQACIDLHTQENEGDRIMQHSLAALFENETNAIELIKWKDIYQKLEGATDSCEDVADALHTIVIKNA